MGNLPFRTRKNMFRQVWKNLFLHRYFHFVWHAWHCEEPLFFIFTLISHKNHQRSTTYSVLQNLCFFRHHPLGFCKAVQHFRTILIEFVDMLFHRCTFHQTGIEIGCHHQFGNIIFGRAQSACGKNDVGTRKRLVQRFADMRFIVMHRGYLLQLHTYFVQALCHPG